MKVLGLTGPSGSGKGFLERILSSRGIPYLDTDALYHRLVDVASPCTEELKEAFGPFVLNSDGSLDRKAMAGHVFCGGEEQKERLFLLNTITHKYVLSEARAWLGKMEKEGYKAAIIDAPLLYESGFDRECDKVIAVLAPREMRIERIMARDGIERSAAQARINAQPTDTFYTDRADFTVINDKDENKAEAEAKRILAALGLL